MGTTSQYSNGPGLDQQFERPSVTNQPAEASTQSKPFDPIHFRYKVMPKAVYFIVQASFIIPLLVLNGDKLTKSNDGVGLFIAFIVVTLLTFASYLRVAFTDPGYINSLMF